MHAQRLRDGRWTVRYRTPDGRRHRTSGHPTRTDAVAAAAAAVDGQEAYVISEGDAGDRYFVGRYRTPDGWLETKHGFDDADDALAEARELAAAARAGAQPSA